jgi:hypothetical protein
MNDIAKFDDENVLTSAELNLMVDRLNSIGKTFSSFEDICYSEVESIFAYMSYTRLTEKNGIFQITCNIPTNSLTNIFTIFSTEKINSAFSIYGVKFLPENNRAFAFLEDYKGFMAGYAPLAYWKTDGIEIGRIHKTDGEFGGWSMDNFSGVFHTEFIVNEE